MNAISDNERGAAPWTEDEARARVGARALDRGRLYQLAGALFDLRREGEDQSMFTARCEGSGAEVYRVRARRAGPSTIEAHCSCPVGDTGGCKHAAALLLEVLSDPAAFCVIEPLSALCERAGGGALATAIEDLVARFNELEPSVRQAIYDALGERPVGVDRSEDPRLAVGEAFRAHAGDPSAAVEVAHALAAVMTRARTLALGGDWAGAARVLRALSAGIMARARRFEDRDGALRELAHSALVAQGRVLASSREAGARRVAREALFDAYRFDAENGTVFGRVAGIVIAERADEHDRAALGESARRACEGLEVWARRVFEGALVDIEGDSLDDEVFIERCREAKRPRELILRLLQRNRVDDAVSESSKMGELALVEALERCDEMECGPAAEALAERLSETSKTRVLAWWRDRLIARGDARTWEASAKLFLARPDRLVWRLLRAEAGERWESQRESLLQALARRGGGPLVEALIDEGFIDRAIEAAQQIQSSSAHEVRVELAERVAKERPLAAAELLRAQAEALIGLRGRSNYREAARLLRRARELYESVHQRGLWVAYAESLRARARELPALKEELSAALARPAAIDLSANNAANDNAGEALTLTSGARG
jgi:hypothetical protein